MEYGQKCRFLDSDDAALPLSPWKYAMTLCGSHKVVARGRDVCQSCGIQNTQVAINHDNG